MFGLKPFVSATELDVAQGRAHHQGCHPESSECSSECPERSLPVRSEEVQILLRTQSGGILSGRFDVFLVQIGDN